MLFSTSMASDSLIAFLNSCLLDLTSGRFKLLLQVTTAAKQTMVKAWKQSTHSIVKTRNKITQAMVHAKVKHVLLDKVMKH